jgi:hypothetical protein
MDRLRVIAEETGFFTRTDALAAGHDEAALRRALRAGVWLRIRPGSYTFPDLWPPTPELLHLCRGRAVARKLGDHVALSHVTAALEHGLRVWGADLTHTHVTRLDGGAGRTEAGVVHHIGSTTADDLVRVEDRLVVRPARAVLETAAHLGQAGGLAVLDSALHLGLVTTDELQATYEILRFWPGMRPVQVVVRLADAGGQSVGESRTRHLCYAHGLPAPRLQHPVRDDTGRLLGTCDFAWPEHRLLGEFDGRIKYGRLLREGELPGDAVYREKVREDRLREATGWAMVRIVWSDLDHPAATAARIRRQLLRVA